VAKALVKTTTSSNSDGLVKDINILWILRILCAERSNIILRVLEFYSRLDDL